jgi:hypothetical protein
VPLSGSDLVLARDPSDANQQSLRPTANRWVSLDFGSTHRHNIMTKMGCRAEVAWSCVNLDRVTFGALRYADDRVTVKEELTAMLQMDGGQGKLSCCQSRAGWMPSVLASQTEIGSINVTNYR